MVVMTDTSTPVGAALRSPAGSSPAEALRFIEDITSDVDSVQERVLTEILAQNADTEYLRNSGAADRVTFRARVPMVEYEDLLPYIQRIVDGDRSAILSTRPVSEFLASSGTTGGLRKLMPSTKDDHDRRKLLNSLVMPVRNMYFPGLDKGKGLYFALVKPGTTTPSGIPVRALTTSMFMNEHVRNPSAARPHDTSPRAAILCADTSQGMYAQMLCGLCQRHDVVRVGAVFASGLLRALRSLQLSWEQLAADIEAGDLAPSRVTDPSVRDAVAGILRPDPELAQFIRAECSSGDWEGIVTRIWPNTKYLNTIVTGTMAQYLPMLNHYSGGLPIVSSIYGSSECYFGLNLNPMCDPSEVSYTIMPNMGYFEFLPVDAAADASQLVDLARVEAGREYEVVVTTYAGLNRYRVGDILRVTGFHNTAPQFRFVRRQNVLLSVEDDKTDEAELQRAVELAAARLGPHGASVWEYTSHACTKSIPGHYVIYWELQLTKGATVDGEILGMCCLDMEEALNSVYRQGRVADGSIGPLEIRVVRSGTFEDLMDHAISRGASFTQYKVPRCVNLPPILELLDSHVVSSHFSPSMPHWTPGRRSE